MDLEEMKKLLQCNQIEAEQQVLPKEYELLYYLIDSDGNGSISKKEFQKLHDGMQKTQYREDIYQLIAFLADKDGDGTISRKEMKIIYKFYKKPMDEKRFAQPISKDECIKIIKTELM